MDLSDRFFYETTWLGGKFEIRLTVTNKWWDDDDEGDRNTLSINLFLVNVNKLTL